MEDKKRKEEEEAENQYNPFMKGKTAKTNELLDMIE